MLPYLAYPSGFIGSDFKIKMGTCQSFLPPRLWPASIWQVKYHQLMIAFLDILTSYSLLPQAKDFFSTWMISERLCTLWLRLHQPKEGSFNFQVIIKWPHHTQGKRWLLPAGLSPVRKVGKERGQCQHLYRYSVCLKVLVFFSGKMTVVNRGKI